MEGGEEEWESEGLGLGERDYCGGDATRTLSMGACEEEASLFCEGGFRVFWSRRDTYSRCDCPGRGLGRVRGRGVEVDGGEVVLY